MGRLRIIRINVPTKVPSRSLKPTSAPVHSTLCKHGTGGTGGTTKISTPTNIFLRHFIVHPRRDPWDGWDDPGTTMGRLRIIRINVPTRVPSRSLKPTSAPVHSTLCKHGTGGTGGTTKNSTPTNIFSRHFIVHPRRDPRDGWDDRGTAGESPELIELMLPEQARGTITHHGKLQLISLTCGYFHLLPPNFTSRILPRTETSLPAQRPIKNLNSIVPLRSASFRIIPHNSA